MGSSQHLEDKEVMVNHHRQLVARVVDLVVMAVMNRVAMGMKWVLGMVSRLEEVLRGVVVVEVKVAAPTEGEEVVEEVIQIFGVFLICFSDTIICRQNKDLFK